MWKKMLCLMLAGLLTAGTVQTVFAGDEKEISRQAAEKVQSSAGVSGTFQYSPSELSTVQVMDDAGLVRYENALMHDGNWYFSVDFFSKYTDYTFSDKYDFFIVDGEQANSSTGKDPEVFRKLVQIDRKEKTISVKNEKTELSDILTINGKVYLPGAEVFPYLDVVCSVENNILVISRAEESFAELLNKFWIGDYYFDGDTAFGNKIVRKAAEGFAWVWDTVTDFRLDRLNPVDLVDEDIRNILSEYMTDTDGYFRYADELSEKTEEMNATMKRAKTLESFVMTGVMDPFLAKVIDLRESINPGVPDVFFPTEVKEASSGFMDTYRQAYEDVDLKLKVFGWAEKLVMKSADYFLNSMAIADDHVDMLLAVYPDMKKSNGQWEREALFLYDAYDAPDAQSYGVDFGRNLFDVLYHDILLDEGFDFIAPCFTSAPLSGIKFALWLGGTIVDVLPDVAKLFNEDLQLYATAVDDLAVFEHHLTAQKKAKEAYEGYLEEINVKGNYTQENLEKMRLSAIMTLLVSKKCYTIMRDNSMNFFATKSQKEAKHVCEVAIEQITDMLAKLYAAGANVLADGREYFQQAAVSFSEEFAGLSAINDSLLKHYWNFLKEKGLDKKSDTYVYLEDINSDGLQELFVTTYASNEAVLTTYSWVDGEIKEIDRQTQKKEDEKVKCIFLTDDEKENAGLFTLTLTVDTVQMQKNLKEFFDNVLANATDEKKMTELIFGCLSKAEWEFTTFDQAGINDIPDVGIWTGGKDKPGALLKKAAEYEGSELLLFRFGDSEVLNVLQGEKSLAHNPHDAAFWFSVIKERYQDKKVPEDELGNPSGNGYAGDISLAGTLFEYGMLVQTLSNFQEYSYIIRDGDADGDNELFMTTWDSQDGASLAIAADLNDTAIVFRENQSAAGGLSFAETVTDGKVLLKEFYYSSMNSMSSYDEWTGTEWKNAARMEEQVQENGSGNWVSVGEGTWWGKKMTSEEFKKKEGAEIADILRGYNPDTVCMQINGNPEALSNDLYKYLREERAALLGSKALTAYSFGDVDLDGEDEEIYVISRPADPWLAALVQEPGAAGRFPSDYEGSVIVVADKINATTLQITLSLHWNDYDSNLHDSDIKVENGEIKVQSDTFLYNGTYIADKMFVG